MDYWMKYEIQLMTMKMLMKDLRCIHFFTAKNLRVRRHRNDSRKWRKVIRTAIKRLKKKNMEVPTPITRREIKFIATEIMLMAMDYWKVNHKEIKRNEIIQELDRD